MYLSGKTLQAFHKRINKSCRHHKSEGPDPNLTLNTVYFDGGDVFSNSRYRYSRHNIELLVTSSSVMKQQGYDISWSTQAYFCLCESLVYMHPASHTALYFHEPNRRRGSFRALCQTSIYHRRFNMMSEIILFKSAKKSKCACQKTKKFKYQDKVKLTERSQREQQFCEAVLILKRPIRLVSWNHFKLVFRKQCIRVPDYCPEIGHGRLLKP
jgi:hypothetical protein